MSHRDSHGSRQCAADAWPCVGISQDLRPSVSADVVALHLVIFVLPRPPALVLCALFAVPLVFPVADVSVFLVVVCWNTCDWASLVRVLLLVICMLVGNVIAPLFSVSLWSVLGMEVIASYLDLSVLLRCSECLRLMHRGVV